MVGQALGRRVTMALGLLRHVTQRSFEDRQWTHNSCWTVRHVTQGGSWFRHLGGGF